MAGSNERTNTVEEATPLNGSIKNPALLLASSDCRLFLRKQISVTAHKVLCALFIGIAMFSLVFPAQTFQIGGDSVLEYGRGVDHVRIFVRKLAQVNRAYESLGFKIYPGGSFPDGVTSSGILLEKCYLELLTVDPAKAKGQAVDRMQFLLEHQGAVFLALNVSSAKTTAEYLSSRGFDVTEPEGGSLTPRGASEPSPEPYRTVHFKKFVVPNENLLHRIYATPYGIAWTKRAPESLSGTP
jgi:hypothetical protein